MLAVRTWSLFIINMKWKRKVARPKSSISTLLALSGYWMSSYQTTDRGSSLINQQKSFTRQREYGVDIKAPRSHPSYTSHINYAYSASFWSSLTARVFHNFHLIATPGADRGRWGKILAFQF